MYLGIWRRFSYSLRSYYVTNLSYLYWSCATLSHLLCMVCTLVSYDISRFWFITFMHVNYVCGLGVIFMCVGYMCHLSMLVRCFVHMDSFIRGFPSFIWKIKPHQILKMISL
jgi:hypothetical protein